MARLLKLVLSIGITVALCWWTFHGTDLRGQLASIREAKFEWLAVYLFFLLAIHVCRTLRWGALLSGIERVPFKPLNEASGIGFMMLLILPLRLGEFARPFLMAQRSGIRRSAAMTSVVLERITDGICIAALLRVLLFFVVSKSPGIEKVAWGSNLLFLVFGGGLAFLLFATWQQARAVKLVEKTAGLVSPTLAEKVSGVVNNFVGAMRQLPSPGQMALFFFYTVLYWALNGIGMAVASRAFPGAEISVFQAFVVLSVLIVFLMIPAAPGMVGTFQAGVKLGLSLFLPMAVVNNSGLAYANVIWFMQTAQQIGLGMILMAVSHTSFGDMSSGKMKGEPALSVER
ncbi:MAG: lysylphosphatidylglycerol synthase transmembrane domain-containing protein [Myxococcaceae bacterium]